MGDMGEGGDGRDGRDGGDIAVPIDHPGDGPDADVVIGLLAEPDRRRVLAAVELGASTLDLVTATTGLSAHRVAKALGKLVDGGIVGTGANGFVVVGDVFAQAARASRPGRRRDEHAAEPAGTRRVLDAFVRNGRILAMPTAPSKRRVLLDWLARTFEPGRRYAETEVNELLDRHDVDPATLRRALVDGTFLDRAAGVYWRAGGTVGPPK